MSISYILFKKYLIKMCFFIVVVVWTISKKLEIVISISILIFFFKKNNWNNLRWFVAIIEIQKKKFNDTWKKKICILSYFLSNFVFNFIKLFIEIFIELFIIVTKFVTFFAIYLWSISTFLINIIKFIFSSTFSRESKMTWRIESIFKRFKLVLSHSKSF